MFKKEIFKAYDIRGEYAKDFDADFAEKLGSVLVNQFKLEKVVVSRDERESSSEISDRVIKGITSAGADAINMGTTSTPLFYFGVINEKAGGGIMVTASHLGGNFNGFKVTGENAAAIGGTELLEKAEKLFESDMFKADRAGKALTKDILEEYAEETIKLSGLKKGDIETKIKLTGNETVINEIRTLTDKLNINVVNDGEDIGFEFDDDGDRIMVHGRDGRKIRGDLVGGLLAEHFYKGKTVIYDLRYSRGVIERLESDGVNLIPSRIGHALIKKLMRERDADFCGEQSGHMYFKEAGYVESTALAMLYILKVIKDTGKTINDLTSGISTWSTTDEINFDLKSRDELPEVLDKIKSRYSDGKLDETDGIKIEYPNWGLLLRPSNTEAKLRLIVDAREADMLDEKREEIVGMLQ